MQRLWVKSIRRYKAFVKNGIADGKRDDLVGGGLLRSVGGWMAVKALRKAKVFQKGDERILGDGDFVLSVLSEAEQAYEKKYQLDRVWHETAPGCANRI